ncbi:MULTISPECIES: hypothetical protein [unclassified Anabaena]|uniref:hypothetical protein n=1 Tax=unclassified Anabaena TaxID=2619674 RepID=UPI0039C6836E
MSIQERHKKLLEMSDEEIDYSDVLPIDELLEEGFISEKNKTKNSISLKISSVLFIISILPLLIFVSDGVEITLNKNILIKKNSSFRKKLSS